MTGQAMVAFDSDQVAPDALVEAIRDTGYDAELPPVGRTAFEEQEERERTQAEEAHELGVKAIVSLALGGLAMIASMYSMNHAAIQWALLALTAFVMVWAGRRIYVGAWTAAWHGAADMNTLVGLGTAGGAFLCSAAVTVAPGFFRAHGIVPDVYYEAAVLILAFVISGRALEARARRQTTSALRKLAGLQPPTARVIRDGVEIDLPVGQVQQGHDSGAAWRKTPRGHGLIDGSELRG